MSRTNSETLCLWPLRRLEKPQNRQEKKGKHPE